MLAIVICQFRQSVNLQAIILALQKSITVTGHCTSRPTGGDDDFGQSRKGVNKLDVITSDMHGIHGYRPEMSFTQGYGEQVIIWLTGWQ